MKNSMLRPTYNLKGQRFGKLVVVEHCGKDASKTNLWKCLCDCGETTVTASTMLRRGTKSCGCIRFKDISGRVFGRLTAIKVSERIVEHPKKGITSFWLCVCECGTEKNVRIDSLMSGSVKSCGCLQKDTTIKRTFTGYKNISSTYWNNVKRNASKSNRDFDITSEYGWEIFEKQKCCCALTGVSITFASKNLSNEQTASLDRIDSNLGYIEGNVQWVHKEINSLKSNWTEQKLIMWARLLTLQAVQTGKITLWDLHSSSLEEASTHTLSTVQ